MTSDQIGWIAVLIFILCVVAAVMQYTAIAWVLAAVGIGLVIFGRTQKS